MEKKLIVVPQRRYVAGGVRVVDEDGGRGDDFRSDTDLRSSTVRGFLTLFEEQLVVLEVNEFVSRGEHLDIFLDRIRRHQ